MKSSLSKLKFSHSTTEENEFIHYQPVVIKCVVSNLKINENIIVYSKVFLGHKKDKPEKLYAIKVMKKEEMVNKNMVNQGK